MDESYLSRIIRPADRVQAENICDVFLRMVKACYEPFCSDDIILMNAVWNGIEPERLREELLSANPEFWTGVFKTQSGRAAPKHSYIGDSQTVNC